MPPGLTEMKRILVQVSVTDSEFQSCRKWLKASVDNIVRYSQNPADVLIVYQTATGAVPKDDFLSHKNTSVYCTPEYSVSKARNRGICVAVERGYHYILFHDAYVFMTRSFIESIDKGIEQNKEILFGKAKWDENFTDYNHPSHVSLHFKKVKPNVLRDAFVWLYLFRVDLIEDLRFNEKIGPGKNNPIGAAEDVLFFYTLFSAKSPILYYCPNALVVHPPRPLDFSKHLSYAKAHGVLYRYLLGRKSCPYYVYLYFILHVLNTVYRIITLKPNALKIAEERFAGFIDLDNKRKLFLQSNNGNPP